MSPLFLPGSATRCTSAMRGNCVATHSWAYVALLHDVEPLVRAEREHILYPNPSAHVRKISRQMSKVAMGHAADPRPPPNLSRERGLTDDAHNAQ